MSKDKVHDNAFVASKRRIVDKKRWTENPAGSNKTKATNRQKPKRRKR